MASAGSMNSMAMVRRRRRTDLPLALRTRLVGISFATGGMGSVTSVMGAPSLRRLEERRDEPGLLVRLVRLLEPGAEGAHREAVVQHLVDVLDDVAVGLRAP